VRTGFITASPTPRVLPLPAPVQVARAEEGPRPPRYSWADWASDRRVERDRQTVLRLLDEVTAVDDPMLRAHRLLRLLADLLHADACAFTQIDFATHRRTTLGWPDDAAAATKTGGEQYLRRPWIHETQPIAPADYRELFAVLGTPYQLAIPLRLDAGTAVACAVGRDHFPFLSDEEGLAVVLQLAIAPLRLTIAQADVPATGTSTRSLLTPREQDVLVLLAAGSTARAIAGQLQVSPRTVCKHLEHIYAKLGVGDRLSAVSQAHSLGLLPLPVRRTDSPRSWADIAAVAQPPRAAPAVRRPARTPRPNPLRSPTWPAAQPHAADT
jgi:DNA-binding CsgD family transcriptional regulator